MCGIGISVTLILLMGAAASGAVANDFTWTHSPAVLEAGAVEGVEFISVKDPSIVRYGDKWHVFCTVRGPKRTHAIVYLNFSDFGEANKAERHILPCHPGYFCAPQVFYFTPQQRWYLICQAADPAWGEPAYRPAFSTTTDVGDPNSWAKLQPLFDKQPEGVKAWLDFWVVCDDAKAHLFWTSLDGRMWRCETPLSQFPRGWSTPAVVLTGDIFEASHTYRLKGQDKYLTLIEAQNGHGWRYYKAYVADRLDGDWQPLAAERDNAFASMRNVTPKGERWTDVISHGELLRSGHDEKLEVDPAHLRFLFQGVLDKDRQGKSYGAIPWRLGVLEPAK